MTATVSGRERISRARRRVVIWHWVPPLAGLLGAAALVAAYFGIVAVAQSAAHARGLLWEDRYFVGGIAAGFGTQIGLFVWLHLAAARARAAGAAGLAAAGTGTSSAAMVACCAHHAADVLPLAGASAAAVFLSEYRLPLMAIGLATNAAAIALLTHRVLRARRESVCEAPS
jgi:hypothetical protein